MNSSTPSTAFTVNCPSPETPLGISAGVGYILDNPQNAVVTGETATGFTLDAVQQVNNIGGTTQIPYLLICAK